jgi:hypothetical protein
MKINMKYVERTSLLLCLLLSISVSAFSAETRLEKPLPEGDKAIIIFADSPLKAMTEIPFTIELTSKTGKKIDNAKLNISLDMPAMQMPPNNPYAEWKDGAYRGMAVFTMAGVWQVNVNIQRPAYDQQQVVFHIEQVLMK